MDTLKIGMIQNFVLLKKAKLISDLPSPKIAYQVNSNLNKNKKNVPTSWQSRRT